VLSDESNAPMLGAANVTVHNRIAPMQHIKDASDKAFRWLFNVPPSEN
jgi:hypothetical protein